MENIKTQELSKFTFVNFFLRYSLKFETISQKNTDLYVKLNKIYSHIKQNEEISEKVNFSDDRLVAVAYKVMTNHKPFSIQEIDLAIAYRYADIYEEQSKRELLMSFIKKNIQLLFSEASLTDEQIKEFEAQKNEISKLDGLPLFIYEISGFEKSTSIEGKPRKKLEPVSFVVEDELEDDVEEVETKPRKRLKPIPLSVEEDVEEEVEEDDVLYTQNDFEYYEELFAICEIMIEEPSELLNDDAIEKWVELMEYASNKLEELSNSPMKSVVLKKKVILEKDVNPMFNKEKYDTSKLDAQQKKIIDVLQRIDINKITDEDDVYFLEEMFYNLKTELDEYLKYEKIDDSDFEVDEEEYDEKDNVIEIRYVLQEKGFSSTYYLSFKKTNKNTYSIKLQKQNYQGIKDLDLGIIEVKSEQLDVALVEFAKFIDVTFENTNESILNFITEMRIGVIAQNAEELTSTLIKIYEDKEVLELIEDNENSLPSDEFILELPLKYPEAMKTLDPNQIRMFNKGGKLNQSRRKLNKQLVKSMRYQRN